MKKKLLALALAGGLSAGANAGVVEAVGGVFNAGAAGASTMNSTTATSLRFTPDGIGHILIVPYFTAQAGNATLVNLVNTDSVNGKWVKVRFRGAQNSDDVFDFQIFMSPGDVWTATITQNSSGAAQLATTDNSCTLPASVSQPFVTDRLPGDATAKAAGTLEGYIEIFNMADVPPFTATTAIETIYETTKHNSSGVAACTASVLAPLATDLTTESAAANLGFDTPTNGLFANWTIVNVPEASSWSGAAAAIVAESAVGTAGRGNFVGHPQTDTNASITTVDIRTADPLLRTGKVGGAFFDLPDLSTPYLTAASLGAFGTGTLADRQASVLTESLTVQSVSNEFVTDPSIVAKTSWVFSLPTRRYSLGVDYSVTTGTNDKLVFNEFVHNPADANYAAGGYFGAPNDTIARDITDTTYAPRGTSNITISGDTACVQLGTTAISAWNRSEVALAGSGFVISPGSATTLEFCGETTVLGFNGTSALGAVIAAKNIDAGSIVDGWARIGTSGLTSVAQGSNGLPVLGASFLKATNPAVSAGTSGNFGASWEHRYAR